MSKQRLYFYGWRVMVVLLLLSYLVYRATLLLEMKSLLEAGIRILIDVVFCCILVRDLFVYRFRLRSIPYFIDFLRGGEPLLVTVVKYVGLFAFIVLLGVGFGYGLSCSRHGEANLFEITVIAMLLAVFLLVISFIASYIKCCVVKKSLSPGPSPEEGGE